MSLMGNYIDKLESAYEKYYKDGVCSHFTECSKGMGKNIIRCDRSALVGKLYGDGTYPRVLAVGQEGLNCHDTAGEPAYSLDGVSRLHYPATLYTLALILKGEEPASLSKDDLRGYEPLLAHFSLTNYYKCTFSADPPQISGLKHSTAMKKYCPGLLIDEIQALEPDLVVVQGQFYGKYFYGKLDRGEELWSSDDGKISLYRNELMGRSFYVLYSYHPAARGDVWRRRLPELKEAIRTFREIISAQR